MTQTYESRPLGDLRPGDILHSLDGIGFAAPRPSSMTVVTAAPVVGETTAHVYTSHTIFTVDPGAEVTYTRVDTTPIILVGRRASLHARLLGSGVPMIRRTPLTADDDAPAVTAQEWSAAECILIDGFLAQTTLRAMWERDEIAPEGKRIVVVGDDLDDARIFGRARAARARGLAILPDHETGLRLMLQQIANDHPVSV